MDQPAEHGDRAEARLEAGVKMTAQGRKGAAGAVALEVTIEELGRKLEPQEG
jgi:hypothetical protein